MMQLCRSLVVLFAPLLLAACSGMGEEELSADSTCEDYLDREQSERHDAAMRISAELDMMDGGNPMYGLTFDSGCSNNREFTLREVFAP
jgi:hypothetical protein